MSKYVMVDCISQYRMRYVVEVPDNVENPTDPNLYPCSPEEYAMDSVTCEDVREFGQKWLGETIVDAREVTLEEAVKQFRKDGDNDWLSDEEVVAQCVTEIGYKA